jgi:DNA-binding transcriptional LysR family regulator
LNTTFLETLMCCARLGSFRKAAGQLHTTQAAVSQRIAALEQELGVQLFERSVRPLRLSDSGERLLPLVDRMLALEEQLKAAARPDAAPAGRVRIGVIESVVHTFLTALMRRVTERAPAVELDLTVDTARNLRERFLRRELDIILQNDALDPNAEDVEVRPLCRYPISWVGRPGLCPQRRLRSRDLAQVPLITFSARSSPHQQLKALCDSQGIEARITSCPSVAGILKLTTEGFGIAAIPPLFVRRQLKRGLLQRYVGPSLPALTISLAQRAGGGSGTKLVAAETTDVAASYVARAGAAWAEDLVSRG